MITILNSILALALELALVAAAAVFGFQLSQQWVLQLDRLLFGVRAGFIAALLAASGPASAAGPNSVVDAVVEVCIGSRADFSLVNHLAEGFKWKPAQGAKRALLAPRNASATFEAWELATASGKVVLIGSYKDNILGIEVNTCAIAGRASVLEIEAALEQFAAKQTEEFSEPPFAVRLHQIWVGKTPLGASVRFDPAHEPDDAVIVTIFELPATLAGPLQEEAAW